MEFGIHPKRSVVSNSATTINTNFIRRDIFCHFFLEVNLPQNYSEILETEVSDLKLVLRLSLRVKASLSTLF